MTPAARGRQQSLAQLRECALATFERRPETRSLLFAVAQYWNDQADDEVHDLVLASRRDVPVWPHFCEWETEDELLVTPGEYCNHGCDYSIGGVGVSPDEFARFCHEFGSQSRPDHENFTPYAIARRRGDGGATDFDLEVIGKLWRPDQDMLPDEPEAGPHWLDLPRARALYELVCASPADDGPRRVLADYLLEHEHPRGELIALALADRLDAEALARRDELLEAHGLRWISPLGRVIPESGAHWERGFLARADVHIRFSSQEVRGAPAWGTVEAIRFLGRDLIDPAMVALRDVGPVRYDLRSLIEAPRPWAIERLHVHLDDPRDIDLFWRTTKLPRLTHLALEGAAVEAPLERPRAGWWPQLERLTLILPEDTPVAAQETCRARHRGLAPWVAVTRRGGVADALGWEVATGPAGQIELSRAGWNEEATPFTLWEIVDALPRDLDVSLAPSPHWAPLPEDAERLAAQADRPIRLASR